MFDKTKWIGRKFKCKKTGTILELTEDNVSPKHFISFGECFVDLGDGITLVLVGRLRRLKMESKFKVGDRVYCVDDLGYTEFYVVEGAIYTVVDKWWAECESDEVSIQDVTEYPNDFKLYKEEPMEQFDMHTQPWFIRVNNEQEFHLVQEWLKENFGTRYNYGWHPQMMGLTNTTVYGEIYSNHMMWFSDDKSLNQNSQEIKVSFKTTIDSVEWPIVESEKDKKIRELKEKIEAATKQIEELENM